MNTLSTQLKEASNYLESELSRPSIKAGIYELTESNTELEFKDDDFSAEEIDTILTMIENQLEKHDAKIEKDKRVKEVVDSAAGGLIGGKNSLADYGIVLDSKSKVAFNKGLGQGFTTKEDQEDQEARGVESHGGNKYQEFLKEILNKDDVMYTDPRTGVELTGEDVWKKLPDTYYPKWVGEGSADITNSNVEKPEYSKTCVPNSQNLVKRLGKQLDKGLEAWENEKKKIAKNQVEKDDILALWNIKKSPKEYYLEGKKLIDTLSLGKPVKVLLKDHNGYVLREDSLEEAADTVVKALLDCLGL
jgi:hypothetical protein